MPDRTLPDHRVVGDDYNPMTAPRYTDIATFMRAPLTRDPTGVDIAWATFAAMVAPLPQEVCPMTRGLRRLYTATEPDLLEALDPILLDHRDHMYAKHLRTPLEF